MTVEELVKELKYAPHMLVTYNNGENGRTDVTEIREDADYHHPSLTVLEIR